MHWLIIALMMILPGDVKADDHITESLCDEIQEILREYRLYTTLTPAQVHAIAGNCYDEVDKIDEKSRSSDHS